MTLKQFRGGKSVSVVMPSMNLGGKFAFERQTTDSVIQRYLIRKNPVILAGPDPRGLIKPITDDDLKKATLVDLYKWWRPKLKDPSYVSDREHQAYAVLTLCRILYTLENGEIVSKKMAAEWAKKKVGEPWTGLIERSLNWRKKDGVGDAGSALDFIRFVLDRIGSSSRP